MDKFIIANTKNSITIINVKNITCISHSLHHDWRYEVSGKNSTNGYGALLCPSFDSLAESIDAAIVDFLANEQPVLDLRKVVGELQAAAKK